MPQIFLSRQDIIEGLVRPVIDAARMRPRMTAAPGTAIAKLADGQDLVLPEPVLDLADTVAADIHGEYLPDNMGGFRIGQKMILILRVDDIPIGRLAVDALAPLGFCLLDRADLLGGVARVKLVEPVAQRRELVILPRRVNAVVDGDIADVVLREDDLDELAGFQVITAQARQVLRDDSSHMARLHLLEHGLQALAVEADAGKAVVHKKARVQKMMLVCVPLEDDLLILDASGLAGL